MDVDDIDPDKLMSNIEKTRSGKCGFCDVDLNEDTGKYMYNKDGKMIPACKKCYFERVG